MDTTTVIRKRRGQPLRGDIDAKKTCQLDMNKKW